MENEIITEYYDCQCACSEHVLRLVYMEGSESEPPELYTDIFLYNPDSILKRIWMGIKYIFGFKCQYGHFDNWMMKAEDAKRLRELLERYEADFLKWKKPEVPCCPDCGTQAKGSHRTTWFQACRCGLKDDQCFQEITDKNRPVKKNG